MKNNEVEDISSSLFTHQRAIQRKNREILMLTSKHEQLEWNKKKLEEQIKALKEKMEQGRVILEERQDQNMRIRNENVGLEAESDIIDDIQLDCKLLTHEIDTLQSVQESIKETIKHDDKMVSVNRRRREKSYLINEQEENDRWNERVENQKLKLEAIEKEKTRAELDLQSLSNDYQNKIKEENLAKKENDMLKKVLEEHFSKERGLNEKISTFGDIIIDKEKMISKFKLQLQKLEENRLKLRQEVKRIQQDIRHNKTKENLEREVMKRNRDQWNRYQQDTQQLDQEINELMTSQDMQYYPTKETQGRYLSLSSKINTIEQVKTSSESFNVHHPNKNKSTIKRSKNYKNDKENKPFVATNLKENVHMQENDVGKKESFTIEIVAASNLPLTNGKSKPNPFILCQFFHFEHFTTPAKSFDQNPEFHYSQVFPIQFNLEFQNYLKHNIIGVVVLDEKMQHDPKHIIGFAKFDLTKLLRQKELRTMQMLVDATGKNAGMISVIFSRT